jgi:type II secretory pathway pseudopilin PulG
MNTRHLISTQRKRTSGMTLVEMLIVVGLGTIVLTMVSLLYMFGLRSFGAMANYADMDAKSRQSVDLMLKEIRKANRVVASQTSGATKWLTVVKDPTTFSPAETNTFTYYSSTSRLVWSKTGQSPRTLLEGCSDWGFTFYIRVPDASGNFISTTDPAQCKLINMAWKCSRNNITTKMNTESMVTAEVVLRNKS